MKWQTHWLHLRGVMKPAQKGVVVLYWAAFTLGFCVGSILFFHIWSEKFEE